MLVQPVRYHVSLLPEGAEDRYLFTITIAYHGNSRWGVYKGAYEYSSLPQALSNDASWDYEGSEERQDEGWLTAHRFTLDHALELAKAQAPEIGIYSHRDKKFIRARDVLESTVDSLHFSEEEKENP